MVIWPLNHEGIFTLAQVCIANGTLCSTMCGAKNVKKKKKKIISEICLPLDSFLLDLIRKQTQLCIWRETTEKKEGSRLLQIGSD